MSRSGRGRPGRGGDPGRLHVALALVDLHLPGVRSLKGKRGLVKRAQATLVQELGASVAEVGHQDVWQRCALGVAVAASTATGAERALDRVTPLLERDPRVVVTGIALEASSFDRDDHDTSLGPLAGILSDPQGWGPNTDDDHDDAAGA